MPKTYTVTEETEREVEALRTVLETQFHVHFTYGQVIRYATSVTTAKLRADSQEIEDLFQGVFGATPDDPGLQGGLFPEGTGEPKAEPRYHD